MKSESEASRELGFLSLLALGINGIVGVGIFFTPNLVASVVPGRAGVLAYLLTLAALLPVALTYARLGARFERDGGPYVWAQAALGEKSAFLVGIASYASAVLCTSAVFAGLGEYTAPLLGLGAHRQLFAVASAAVLAAIVLSGLKPSAWVWSSLTVLKLLPLFALVGVFALTAHPAFEPSAAPHDFSWSRAVLLIVFPMQG
ncbi:MAG TPA: amino acid permease, partial [Polyangiaceae bacterium]